MTEKRFSLAYADYDWWAICDKKNPTELGISGEEVVELLNELHEENQALKSDRARYEEECRLDVFKELFEENEQLKVANGEMEDYLARIEEENRELEKFRYSIFKKMEELLE